MFVRDKAFYRLNVSHNAPPRQRGPMDILLQTVRKEGFFALYKGLSNLTIL
jgi:Mitochondrial carrier protein